MRLVVMFVGVWGCMMVLWGDVEAAPCCGVGLVVGGLAIAGGAVAAKHHHRRHHHHHGGGGGCHNCGCGGCGGSCGWCGGHYGKRRRRETSEFLTFLQDAEVQQAYSKIATEDKDECGLRLVCELAQKDPRELVNDEIQILLPYRGLGESDGSVYGNYDEAVWHGQEGHTCTSYYPQCAFNATQIMGEFRKYNANNGTFILEESQPL